MKETFMKSRESSLHFPDRLLFNMFLIQASVMNEILAQETVLQPFRVIESPEGSLQKSDAAVKVTYFKPDETTVSQIITEQPIELSIEVPLTRDLFAEITLERNDIITGNTQIAHGTNFIPNPNKGQFSFRIYSDPPVFFTLKLVNSSGKILKTRLVKSVGINNIEQFNISHMSKVIYFLIISTDKNNFSEKIVVI